MSITSTVSGRSLGVPGAEDSTNGARRSVRSAERPLLVGERPAPTDSPGVPSRMALTGRPARVLLGTMGVEGGDYGQLLLDRFETVNLFPEYEPSWDRVAARVRAADLRLPEVTVLLGRRVAEAFGLGRFSYFHWTEIRGSKVTLLPHPSGLNRLYNDGAIRSRVGETLREAIGRMET